MILRCFNRTANLIKNNCTVLNVRNYNVIKCERIERGLSVLSLDLPQKPTNQIKDVIFSVNSIAYNTNKPMCPIKPNILDIPIVNKIPSKKINIIINDVLPVINDVDLPSQGNIMEKKAHRVMIQRRRKMKKHQLKKWRKKFKFFLRRRHQKRTLQKEKEFQNVLVNRIKLAEVFNPEQYVVDKLKRAATVPIMEKYKKPPVTSNVLFHPGFPDEANTKK